MDLAGLLKRRIKSGRVREQVRAGDAARNAQDWGSARQAYAAALAFSPGLAHIWVQYGHALKEQGSTAEALAAYRRADVLLPGLADTHLQIGRAPWTRRATSRARSHTTCAPRAWRGARPTPTGSSRGCEPGCGPRRRVRRGCPSGCAS